jgi:hypothetical protein
MTGRGALSRQSPGRRGLGVECSAAATTALAQAEWLDRGITAPAAGGIECSTKHLDHPDLVHFEGR